MATQPLFQPYSPPIPLLSRPNIRVAFAPGDATARANRAVAKLPTAVREATLDEIAVGEMATAMISRAQGLLSAPMYKAFVGWGAAAAMFATEYDDGDELCTQAVNAIEALATVPAWTFQDFMLKTWLLSIEASDSSPFGPLKTVPKNTSYLTVVLADGLGSDMSRASPIVEGIERLARFASGVGVKAEGFSFGKRVGQLIANAFLVAQSSDVGRRPDAGWASAMAAYLSAESASAATSCDAPEADARANACSAAMDYLIEHVRAPDITALNTKLDLALDRAEWFEDVLFDDHARGIAADIRHLAEAAAVEPHSVWLSERNAALLAINSSTDAELSDSECDLINERAIAKETQIALTPAASERGLIAKLSLLIQTLLEGHVPDLDECAAAIIDVRRICGIGSLAAAAEARYREMAA